MLRGTSHYTCVRGQGSRDQDPCMSHKGRLPSMHRCKCYISETKNHVGRLKSS